MRTSLNEVAQKVAEGGSHPKVRAWAVEQLERARRLEGISCTTDRERADVLLRAVQKKLWVPDPVGTEFMAGAHLMACDRSTPDELCFMSDDCDGLAILLGSCFLSVGLHTTVVGHGYDREKNIQHVLLVVRVRKQGGAGAISGGRPEYEWLYADPSLPRLKLGQVTPFTRERALSVPNVKVICDANVCFTGQDFDPDELGFVQRGIFVGVDGAPERSPKFVWLAQPQNFRWLAAPSMLGQEKSAVEVAIDKCQGAVANADLSTAAARGESFKNGGKCAAEALCAYYSAGAAPGGLCSSVAEPIVTAVVNVWNALFGGDAGIDCSKVSTVDPCHPCTIFAWQFNKCGSPSAFGGFDALTRYQDCIKRAGVPSGCADEREVTAEEARVAAVVAANQTLLTQYQNLSSDAVASLLQKYGGTPTAPSPTALQKINQFEKALPPDPTNLDSSKPETGLVIAKSLTQVAPAYQQVAGEPLQSEHIPAGAPAARGGGGGGALPVVAGLGILGLIAWALLK